MKTNQISKYTFILFLLILTFGAKSQEEYVSFLKLAKLPACFENLEPIHIDELFEYGKTSFKGFEISSHFDQNTEVFELTTRENCHDTKKLQLKYVKNLTGEFIFLFQERIDGEHNYGNIKLYEYQDSTWNQGKEIAISWTQLFDIDKEDLDELRELDQYPKCMVKFVKDGMRIEIPWQLYTTGDEFEDNGFVKGGGKQPITIQYSHFLK
jgi:hypothetical protein